MLCPNCKETIQDHLLICPLCKEAISEPVTFKKRSVQINKEALQIYDELTQEDKKDHDYLKMYKKDMFKQAKSLNLNNDQQEDVLDILGREAPEKPNLFFEVVLTILSSIVVLALVASQILSFVIPYGVTTLHLIYATLGLSVLTLLIIIAKLFKHKKAQTLILVGMLHLIYLAAIIYLHFFAKTL